LLGQQQLTLTQLHIGLSGVEILPGAQDFGFGLIALGFEGAGVHARQQLSFADLVAFIHQHLGQAPGSLAGDLHLGGFQAPVAHRQPLDQPAADRHPVTEATRGGE